MVLVQEYSSPIKHVWLPLRLCHLALDKNVILNDAVYAMETIWVLVI